MEMNLMNTADKNIMIEVEGNVITIVLKLEVQLQNEKTKVNPDREKTETGMEQEEMSLSWIEEASKEYAVVPICSEAEYTCAEEAEQKLFEVKQNLQDLEAQVILQKEELEKKTEKNEEDLLVYQAAKEASDHAKETQAQVVVALEENEKELIRLEGKDFKEKRNYSRKQSRLQFLEKKREIYSEKRKLKRLRKQEEELQKQIHLSEEEQELLCKEQKEVLGQKEKTFHDFLEWMMEEKELTELEKRDLCWAMELYKESASGSPDTKERIETGLSQVESTLRLLEVLNAVRSSDENFNKLIQNGKTWTNLYFLVCSMENALQYMRDPSTIDLKTSCCNIISGKENALLRMIEKGKADFDQIKGELGIDSIEDWQTVDRIEKEAKRRGKQVQIYTNLFWADELLMGVYCDPERSITCYCASNAASYQDDRYHNAIRCYEVSEMEALLQEYQGRDSFEEMKEREEVLEKNLFQKECDLAAVREEIHMQEENILHMEEALAAWNQNRCEEISGLKRRPERSRHFRRSWEIAGQEGELLRRDALSYQEAVDLAENILKEAEERLHVSEKEKDDARKKLERLEEACMECMEEYEHVKQTAFDAAWNYLSVDSLNTAVASH